MAISLNGKVCLVTGATDGIGLGLARGFQKRGAKVVVGARRIEDWKKELPALALPMDVTVEAEVQAAVAETVRTFGRLDVLVNNAGIYPRVPADQLTFEDWRRIMDVNLDGAWRCCQAVIPHFKQNGAGVIINAGSITVRLGMANFPHYLASKGGVIGLTRGLARDLGRFGVRVNCVQIGGVQTETEVRAFPNQDELRDKMNALQCLPGRMTPESIEPVFAFLASDESSDITGQCLTADRGWTHD